MTYGELVKGIEKLGGRFLEHGGSHDVYFNPQNGQKSRIPRHWAQEVKHGTLNRILKDLGFK